MNTRPLNPNFGLEVRDVDVRELNDQRVSELQSLIDDFRVVVVRNQCLQPQEQADFSARMAPLYRMPYIAPLAGHPDVIAVLKEADERNVSTFGSWWHADFSYLAEPPVYSILHAIELPACGGDTLFADMIGAYENLSSGLRSVLGKRRVMHSGHIYGTRLAQDGAKGRMRSVAVTTGHEEADVERAHPLVRLHPPTGRAALNANPTYSTRLEHLSSAESKPLLGYLYQQFSRPEHTLRQRWQAGDLLIWDNRAVTHLAVNDYDGHRRLLHRTTAGWETPVPAFH